MEENQEKAVSYNTRRRESQEEILGRSSHYFQDVQECLKSIP